MGRYPWRHGRLRDPAFFAECALSRLSGGSSDNTTVGSTSGTRKPPWNWKAKATELCPGVFCIPSLLPPEVCAALVEELESFESWAAENQYEIARPNSMNRYGAVLNEVGFGEAMH